MVTVCEWPYMDIHIMSYISIDNNALYACITYSIIFTDINRKLIEISTLSLDIST